MLCTPMNWRSPPGSSVHGLLQTRLLEWVAIIINTSYTFWSPHPHPVKLQRELREAETMGLPLSTMLYCTGRPHSSGDTGLKQVHQYEKCFVNNYKGSQNWANPNTPSGLRVHSTHHFNFPNLHHVLKQGPKSRADVRRCHSSCVIFRALS